MQGLMMNMPLTITAIMRSAERLYPDSEVVSITLDNPRHRYTYRDAFRRVRRLANALQRLGVATGDRIATLAWNDHRHLELYYATSCSGLVCHTINPRLFEHQIEYIINHAEDRWLFCDATMVPLLEQLQDRLPGVRGFIVMTDEAHMPENSLRNAACYESLLGAESEDFDWPQLDENQASALCYTSGTTGNPKGVLYSHRSTVLHCYGMALPDCANLSISEVVMPIVPMFHVNGWGMVYLCPMVGAKLVLPGPRMGDGETLCRLINSEGVTFSMGVPTVWLALLDHLKSSGERIDSLKRIAVGGAACPLSVMQGMAAHGVETEHAWGMTEMSPVGVYNTLKPGMEKLPTDELTRIRLKQGRPPFGVELKIVDADNRELPWDGRSMGSLKVRGPWICRGYFRQDHEAVDEDGWFETGDVATIDPEGFIQITDRSKDLIKSGGEWISSIELENCAVNHPKVAEAAVIAVADEKWGERPLLIAVPSAGEDPSPAELLQWFEGRVAHWWIPDQCLLVDSLPHTATGKLDKKALRTNFSEHPGTG